MKPRGSEALFAMRLKGRKPSTAFIEFGYGATVPWTSIPGMSPWIRVLPTDPVEILDLRCFLGLDVVLEFDEWDDRIHRLVARLKEVAQSLYIVSLSYAPEMGWCWHKQFGELALGEMQWALQWNEARLTSCHTPQETAKRLALEAEAVRAAAPGATPAGRPAHAPAVPGSLRRRPSPRFRWRAG